MVAAVNVAVVDDMPLAVGMEEAEIVAAESDEKADVEPSVDTETDDEATDVESAEEQDLAINEAQQASLDDTSSKTYYCPSGRKLGQLGMLLSMSLLRRLTNKASSGSMGQQEAAAEADDGTVSLEEVMINDAQAQAGPQPAGRTRAPPGHAATMESAGYSAEAAEWFAAATEAELATGCSVRLCGLTDVELLPLHVGVHEPAGGLRWQRAVRQCGTPGCERDDHHPGLCTSQQVVGSRQRRPSARVVEKETDDKELDAEEQEAAESYYDAHTLDNDPFPTPPPTEMSILDGLATEEVMIKDAEINDVQEVQEVEVEVEVEAEETEAEAQEEELRNCNCSGSRSSPASTGKRTREEGSGSGSTRDGLASEEHAAATPQAADPVTDLDDNDGDSSIDWEPARGSSSMQGSQRKHPRRGEASSPASEVTEAKCGVCRWDDDEAGNEILLCDGPSCDAAFHQKYVAALYASQHTSHSICAKALATAPYPGACPRPSTTCLRASGSAPLASSQRA